MKEVKINGEAYRIAYNLRSLFTYEEISGHQYEGKKTVDCYMLLYAMLIANNENFSLEFSELIEACDDDLAIFSAFCEVMEDYAKRMSAFVDNKKKVSR